MDRAFASACVNCRNSPSMDAALPPEAAHSLKVRLGLGFASDWATGWKHSNATLQLSLHFECSLVTPARPDGGMND